ncbi:MAG TPA: hypothetical protein VF142_19125 [Longimicrobium sp.]
MPDFVQDPTSAERRPMTCATCHADATDSSRNDDFFPRCHHCGQLVMPPEATAELEGFRARLAQFGLGGDRLTRSVHGNGGEG